VLEFLRFFLSFFLVVEMAGFFRKVSLVFGRKLAECGGCSRLILAGLVSKQLSKPAVYVGACWQGAGRVEGVLSKCHDR
jgi:hypothetical protein